MCVMFCLRLSCLCRAFRLKVAFFYNQNDEMCNREPFRSYQMNQTEGERVSLVRHAITVDLSYPTFVLCCLVLSCLALCCVFLSYLVSWSLVFLFPFIWSCLAMSCYTLFSCIVFCLGEGKYITSRPNISKSKCRHKARWQHKDRGKDKDKRRKQRHFATQRRRQTQR